MRYVKYLNSEAELKLTFDKLPLFSALFNDAPDAIFLLNAKNYSIIDCNSKALEIFEADSKTSLIDLPSFRLYESEPVEFSRNLLETNLKNGGEHTQELAFRTLKQNIFWGRLKNRSLRIEEDEYVVLRISKVIDYLRAEEALSTLLRGTAKATGKMFFKELTKLLCRSFDVKYSYVGKLASDKKSLKIIDYCGPINEKDSLKCLVGGTMNENVLRGYTTFYPKGAKELFPDDSFAGKYNIEGFMGAPLYGNSGEVMGILAFMHDKPVQEIPNSRYILSIFASRSAAEIQRMRSKEILKEQTRNLADANALKDKLLSVISHNLINPLQSAMGFSELLRMKIDTYEKSKIIENVEIVDNSVRNIYFLVENLSDWSRIYRDKIKIHPEDILLNEIFEDVLSLFKYIIDIKELKVDIKLKGVSLLHTDKHMIEVIIRNILSNAVKYTSKGSCIYISFNENDNNVSVIIKDSGIGMSEEEIKIIYKAEGNIPELNMADKNIAGFGLLLTKNFVKRLGGMLLLESEMNTGTKVTFTIPKHL
jgi:signal transduction histidine kinase